MSHPQNSPRTVAAFTRLEMGSDGTGVLTSDSTGNLRYSKGISISGETSDVITQNSTGLLLSGGIALSGEETDVITQNSTSVLFAGGIQVSGETNATLSGLSTGVVAVAVKIGAQWLTSNSTGILLDGALLATAGDIA